MTKQILNNMSTADNILAKRWNRCSGYHALNINALFSHPNSKQVWRAIPSSGLCRLPTLPLELHRSSLLPLPNPTSFLSSFPFYRCCCPRHPILTTSWLPVSVSESTSSGYPLCFPALPWSTLVIVLSLPVALLLHSAARWAPTGQARCTLPTATGGGSRPGVLS